jgi:hypothetical protein
MQAKTPQDLSGDGALHAAENDALHAEAIVEPAVWIPDFPGDEPEMEYTDWRDLLFVYGGARAVE